MSRQPKAQPSKITKSQITWIAVSYIILGGIFGLIFSFVNGRSVSQGATNAVASAAGVLVGLVVYFAVGRSYDGWPAGILSLPFVTVHVARFNSGLLPALAYSLLMSSLLGATGGVIDRALRRGWPKRTPGGTAMYDPDIDQRPVEGDVEPAS